MSNSLNEYFDPLSRPISTDDILAAERCAVSSRKHGFHKLAGRLWELHTELEVLFAEQNPACKTRILVKDGKTVTE